MQRILDEMVRAWAAGDAEAYAECFTADASYVTFVGTAYLGREDIAECHRALFRKFAKGTTLQMTVLDARVVAPGVMNVVTEGDKKVQSYTLVSTDAGWRCAAFQNTKRQPLLERISILFDRRFRPMRLR